MAASVSGTLSGRRKTDVSGVTAYSASPPMLYIAMGVPSGLPSRVVPSYSWPFSRLYAKNVSHRSSLPRTQ